MSQIKQDLTTLKNDAEKLNESINQLYSEALSYKNASKTMTDVADNMNQLTDKIFKLTNKTEEVIETLYKIDATSFLDMKSETDSILKQLTSMDSTISSINTEAKLIKEEAVTANVNIMNTATLAETLNNKMDGFVEEYRQTYSTLYELEKSNSSILKSLRTLIIIIGGIALFSLLILFTKM